jgi:hypothetical protein
MASSSSSSVVKSLHPLGCQCDACCTVSVPRPVNTLRTLLRGAKGPGRGGFDGLRPIKVKLWSVVGGTTSSAASNLAQISLWSLSTGNFPELADFLAIYDQLRMIKVRVHAFPFVSLAPAASPFTSTTVINLQFDPSVSAPSSITNALQESYHVGPFETVCGTNSYAASAPFQQKYLTLSATPPKLAPITGSDCPGSSWITLDATTAPTMCAVGYYSTALGTSGTVTMKLYVELDVELRLRT